MSGIQLPSALGAIPKAPERYDRANEDAFRRGVEQALQIMKSASITGLKSSDIPVPLVLGTDPTALVGTPVLRAGDDIAIGKAGNPALRLWNTTGGTGRKYALYSGTAGFVELYDDTAGAAVLTINSAKKFTLYGELLVGALAASATFRFQAPGTPQLYFLIDTSEAVDNTKWRVYSNTGSKQIKWQVINDAENAATDWLRVTRSGTTPTLTEFLGGTTGALILGLKSNSASEAALQIGEQSNTIGKLVAAQTTINSSTPTALTTEQGRSGIYLLRDATTGSGSALVLVEAGSGGIVTIVAQNGSTVYTTGAPTAAQVQLTYNGQLNALGGSSRNGVAIRVLQLTHF